MIVLDFTLTEAKKIEQALWQIHMQKHRDEWVDTMRTVFDVVIHSLIHDFEPPCDRLQRGKRALKIDKNRSGYRQRFMLSLPPPPAAAHVICNGRSA